MFLCSACPVRFWEIGLESWHISQKIGWVSTVRAGSTHWVFLATPWFFAWTQIDWRSIQCESYVNPVLCVFEKLAYKVFKLQKTMAEFLRFVVAVLIEFSLRHPDSLHEHSLTEGQSTERELRESSSVRFCEINLQSWHISQKIGWVPIVRAGSTHWVFLMTPWFFEWTQFDWRSIQWESYVNPVLCVFEKLSYKVGIFHKKLAEFLLFVLAVLIEFSLRQPGSLHEHRLPEGQSTERVTWILSCAFLRNWLTKLANFKKQWLSSYVSWGRYSLSFPCDTLVLCMNPAWGSSERVMWILSCAFFEKLAYKFIIFHKKLAEFTVRAGSTHWPSDTLNEHSLPRSQWESYVNPVLCVFEKLAYKVGIFHKKLAEFLRFVLAVLIEFSLRHPGSLHEHRLTEGQSSERVTWILSCAFFWEIGLQSWHNSQKNWLSSYGSCWHSLYTLILCIVRELRELCVFVKLAYKVGKFQKTMAECLRFVVAVLIEFSLRHPGSLHEHSLTEGQSSERVTWILSCAFLRNWLTKLANFKKQWLSSYVSWWRYSLSFPCDTLILCVNTAWLKVNPVRELRESCPVRFWEIGLQSWHISQNIGWVPTVRAGSTHWVFLATPWFFAWTQFNWGQLRELREGQSSDVELREYVSICPVRFVRFWEIGLQSWHISQKIGWVSYCSCWQYSLSFPCDTLVLCMNTVWLKVNPVRELRESCPVRFWEIGLQSFQTSKKQWLSSYVSWWRYSLSFPCDTLTLCMNPAWLKVNPVRESYVNPVLCVFEKLAYKVGIFHKTIGWVPTVRAGSTHWVFLMAPWFFEWTQFDWRSIQWESYVNPVHCVFEKLSYKVGIFHKKLAEFLLFVLAVLIEFSTLVLCMNTVWEGQSSEKVTWILSCAFFAKLAYKVGIFHKKLAEFLRFVLAVLIEFSLRHPGSLHEHRLTEGQSSERVTWILSCAFLRNWLTKLANFKKQWLSSYGSWWRYSLSFPCDTLVLWMNTVWLKVNPVRELRESCPVRFWEISLQSWYISQNIGWVPTVRAGSTHWVFLATQWFFEWTQFDWRSIQWGIYVNPVLCVFVKLAYKVGKFQKTTAECLLFVVAVLIEFSLRHPGSLHEHSLTEGQSSERVKWILFCAFWGNWLTKLANLKKQWLSSYVSW